MDEFCRRFFEKSGLLVKYRNKFDDMYTKYKQYKDLIPVYGAALLNKDMTKVLLLTGFKSRSWGFPKGKKNQGEDELKCALREVQEETGYDASQLNPRREDHVVWRNKTTGKTIKIFFIAGVPEEFNFRPTVQKEVGEIRWFNIEDLPLNGYYNQVQGQDTKKDNFWGVSFFVHGLRKWIARKTGRPFPTPEMLAAKKHQQKKEEDEAAPTDSKQVFSIDWNRVKARMAPYLYTDC